jgi:ubiquinone/menaquinone biosynthesis C-methylase UbiE
MLDALQCCFLDWFTPRYAALTRTRKQRLFAGVRGELLELGAGTGANFEFLPPAVRWTGVDPNPKALPYIRAAAGRTGHAFHFHAAEAETLPFADGCFDAVACTLTLCSVGDPARVLEEVRRVLRPGGELLFLEHVAAPDGSRLRRRQRLVRSAFRCLVGCTPDRDTGALLQAAGFASVEMERFNLSLPVVAPHICGRAVR